MSRAEQVQFAAGAIILVLIPVVILFLGGQTLLGAIAIVSAVSWAYMLRRGVCVRCVNFSCPMNAVPKELVDAWLERHPAMRKGWERSGYRLG